MSRKATRAELRAQRRADFCQKRLAEATTGRDAFRASVDWLMAVLDALDEVSPRKADRIRSRLAGDLIEAARHTSQRVVDRAAQGQGAGASQRRNQWQERRYTNAAGPAEQMDAAVRWLLSHLASLPEADQDRAGRHYAIQIADEAREAAKGVKW